MTIERVVPLEKLKKMFRVPPAEVGGYLVPSTVRLNFYRSLFTGKGATKRRRWSEQEIRAVVYDALEELLNDHRGRTAALAEYLNVEFVTTPPSKVVAKYKKKRTRP